MPLKILVELDRISGEYNVTFEGRDESRWKMTRESRGIPRGAAPQVRLNPGIRTAWVVLPVGRSGVSG
jgi:hypothetical protein